MRVVDLFSGCGGMSLGFEQAGYELLAAFDNWGAAVQVYQENFNHPIISDNLENNATLEKIRNYHPEIIIGGPPCQDFSSAGKRDEKGSRADLTIRFAEIISTIKPKYFVMENVERIQKTAVLQSAKAILQSNHYGLFETVLDASYCGVPQSRKRYFLFGELEANPQQLQIYLRKNLASRPMTIYDYLGNSLGIEYYYRHPRSYARRAIFSIYEPSPTIRGVNRPIPDNYKKHPNDLVEITPDLRPLTTLERSYIQTFPRSFKFFGTKTNLEQMIGNAVPVKLAEFVARAILDYIHKPNMEQEDEIMAKQLSLFGEN